MQVAAEASEETKYTAWCKNPKDDCNLGTLSL